MSDLFSRFWHFSLYSTVNPLFSDEDNSISQEGYGKKECNITYEDFFPDYFTFGASTAAYQVEGAWNVDGRGPSVWDTAVHEFPDRVKDRSNGDVAIDSYHRYEEDVQVLKEMGVCIVQY